MNDTTRPEYLEQASRFICDTRLEDLSPEALNIGRWVIADSIPVVAAGMQMREMRALVDAHLPGAGSGKSWVIGSGRTTNARDAAMLNGTAGTWLELDEGNLFAKGHPGIQVVPAAVAAAQELGSSGADLLLAATLGYEVSARISRAAEVRMSIHPHGTYGVIGAAIAVGKLKKFSQPQMRELINVASTMGMATSRNTLLTGSTVRNIFTGHSGFMGQMAVRMVEAGFEGEPDGVKSVYGRVLSDKFDPQRMVAGLGDEWLVAKNYFKLWCIGRYAHSAVDAFLDAQSKAPGKKIDAARVKRIDVSAYSLAASLAGKNITTSFGARFSVPFALATLLHHGHLRLSAFDDDAVANPAVQQLVARMFIEENPAYTAAFPDQQPVDVRITMDDGSVIAGHCEVTKGEPANPHRTQELEDKFFELGTPVWSQPTTRRLYDGLMRLEHIEDFSAFAAQFQL